MPERCTYIARSTAIAARALAGEMMVMNSTDSTFFTLNEVATAIFQAADGRTPLRDIVRDRICDNSMSTSNSANRRRAIRRRTFRPRILLVSSQPLSSDSTRETP